MTATPEARDLLSRLVAEHDEDTRRPPSFVTMALARELLAHPEPAHEPVICDPCDGQGMRGGGWSCDDCGGTGLRCSADPSATGERRLAAARAQPCTHADTERMDTLEHWFEQEYAKARYSPADEWTPSEQRGWLNALDLAIRQVRHERARAALAPAQPPESAEEQAVRFTHDVRAMFAAQPPAAVRAESAPTALDVERLATVIHKLGFHFLRSDARKSAESIAAAYLALPAPVAPGADHG